MTSGLDIAVLGPLVVRVRGAEVVLTQQRSRQLLALFASRVGRPWAWRELADELWHEESPGDPHRTIQVLVSRLRAALGSAADHVVTVPEGYVLVAGTTVDAVVFDGSTSRALSDASAGPETLIGELEPLTELWRGGPLPDVDRTPRLDRWAAELEERRRRIDRALADAYRLVGRLDDAIALAHSLVARDDTDELAACSLARSLARRGNKAQALRALDALRTALRDGLGVDPSSPVLDLEREILHGDVELVPHQSARSLAPQADRGDGAGFVARRAELDAIVAADRPRLVAVVGDVGIGKSELLRTAAGRLRASGVGVAAVEVSPLAAAPLEPVRSVLRQLAELGFVADEPVAAWATGGGDGSPSLGASREDLIELLAESIDDALASAGWHVMVDDAHWLDRTSAAVFTRLVERARSHLTVFARPDAVDGFWRTASASSRTIVLAPFGEDDVREFLAANHPSLASSTISTILHRRSGGNPLFLSLIADGVEEGTLTSGNLPISLLMAAAERLASLPPHVRRTVEIAAVVGDEFDLATVTSFEPYAAAHLADAERSGIVRLGTGVGVFSHGIMAEATRELLPPVRRLDLHDAIGTMLFRQGAPASSYVDHFDRTTEIDPLRAVRARLAAGCEYTAVDDHEGALEHFERALEHLGLVAAPPAETRARVLFHLGAVERRVGRPDHVARLLEAARLAKAVGAEALVFEALIELCGHGGATLGGDVDAEVMELLTTALSEAPPPDVEARLCSAAATLLSFSSHGDTGRKLFRAAWSTAESLGDDGLEAAVLMNTHLGLTDPDDWHDRDRAICRLAALAGDDADRQWECAFLAFTQSLVDGRGADLDRAMGMMRALDALPKDRPRDFGMAFCESAYATVRGRLDDAEDHANRALAIGASRYTSSWALGTYAALVLSIKDAAGELAAVGPTIESTLRQFPDEPNLTSALALSLALQGERRRAVAQVRGLIGGERPPLDRNLAWTAAMSMLARAAAITGDESSMTVIRPQLASAAGRMAFMAVAVLGPVDEALGLVAHGLGDVDAAREHAAAARAIVGRSGAAIYEGRVDALEARIGGLR